MWVEKQPQIPGRAMTCQLVMVTESTLLLLFCTSQVLKTPKVLLFPVFSVGVNLGFIALLAKYQTDAFLNPLFQ
jgi:hypothetical protein